MNQYAAILFCTAVFWIALNAAAFTMFARDKWAAENGRWRIPESNLLLIAFIGGSIGAIAGQKMLRHKTRKEPFRSILFSIAALHLAVVSYLVFKLLFSL